MPRFSIAQITDEILASNPDRTQEQAERIARSVFEQSGARDEEMYLRLFNENLVQAAGHLSLAIQSLDVELTAQEVTLHLQLPLFHHTPDAKMAMMLRMRNAISSRIDRKIDELKIEALKIAGEEKKSDLYDSLFNDEEIL